MRYSTQIKPISDLEANAEEIVEYVAETRNAVIITQDGRATAVLQDLKSFEEAEEKLALLTALALSRQRAAGEGTRPAREAIDGLRAKTDQP